MSGRARGTAPLYRPVPPTQMFLDEAEWQKALSGRAVVQLSPFSMPEESPHPHPPPLSGGGAAVAGLDSVDAGARPAENLCSGRSRPPWQPLEEVREVLYGATNAR